MLNTPRYFSFAFERMVVEQWLEFHMKRDLKGFNLI